MLDILESLNGVDVAVFGGARGLGAAIATGFRAAGSTVVVVDRLAESEADIEAGGAYIQADLSLEHEVERAFAEIDQHLASLAVVVNTVGITGALVPAEEMTPDEWRSVVAVNLSGPFWVCQQAARRMLRRGRGSIVNTASLAGIRIVRNQPHVHYNATKAALITMGQALADEWGPRGVRVNTIAPGAYATEMVRDMWRKNDSDLSTHYARAAAATPIGRIAEAQDVVPLALFLASQASSYLTGQVIVSDGGRGLGFK
jgi:NAD(P)-dependent dehydrogenase (short-subunit alcohol dehydrogenase family)